MSVLGAAALFGAVALFGACRRGGGVGVDGGGLASPTTAGALGPAASLAARGAPPVPPSGARGLAGMAGPYPTESCYCEHGPTRVVHRITPCPAEVAARVAAWRPDAITVLGGGILRDGEPNCATSQRAACAQRLFDQLDGAPALVLSGWGPARPPERVDDAAFTCVQTRLARALAASGEATSVTAPLASHLVRTELVELTATRRASLTEADLMCAVILRAEPAARWPAVLERVQFESRAESTVENAAFTVPLIERNGYRRVLVLSTPVVHPHGGLDNHPARALSDFRAARRGERWFRLAAIGCPYEDGGPVWSEFEE